MNDGTDIATNGTPFDIADVGLSRIEDGARMVLRHPVTGEVLKNGAGQDVSITLLSQHSEAFRQTIRRIQIERPFYLAQLKKDDPTFKDGDPLPLDRPFDEDTELLCSVTRNWTIDQLDGQPFPCDKVHARRLWSDPRFIHFRNAALIFIAGDRNFLSVSNSV